MTQFAVDLALFPTSQELKRQLCFLHLRYLLCESIYILFPLGNYLNDPMAIANPETLPSSQWGACDPELANQILLLGLVDADTRKEKPSFPPGC